MTINTFVALFAAMVVLAIIPGPSVFAVVARSLTSGLSHGLITVVGIVAGDILFIVLAVCGLWSIAETMEGLFVAVKYLGCAFLVWLGFGLWRLKPKSVEVEGVKELSWVTNFSCGFLITISDPKAILFYVSFFPAFVDLRTASMADIGLTIIAAILAVGGSKLVYAYMADKARILFRSARAKKVINIIAGSIMVGTAMSLLILL